MKAISLFSGAGGDTLGLEKAGVDVVGFVEWAEPMIQTHLANFPNSHLIGKDICKIKEEELIDYIDQIDIIFAGFPCQGFSKGGKKDPKDKRSNLFREFVRLTEIIRPKWIIGENVKHILKMKTDTGDSVPDVIQNAFEAIGYTMAEPKVFKMEDYNIPQKRERCFFVGNRNRLNFDWNLVSSKAGLERTVLLRILEPTLENAIEITEEQVQIYKINQFIEITDNNIDITGSPPLNLRKCIEVNQFSFGKRESPTHSEIVDPSKYAKTLICTYNRMPRMFVALRKNGRYYLRPFTVNEAKQIQGFPPDYIITGNRMSAIQQIGNAVPYPMVKLIVEAIRTYE
jgi:DNA (cytosine-5)-methyltransferase 1